MALTFKDENTVRKIVREEVKVEVKEQLTDFRSEIKGDLDTILKEILNVREEMIMFHGHKDQLEDHEERIETIETELNLSLT